MGAVFLANLAAYIAGGGEVLASAGLPESWSKLVFYAAAASVVAFGLKALGVAKKLAVGGMILLFAILVGASILALARGGTHPMSAPRATPTPARLCALYGMAMFCFAAFFSVPQAAKGLADRPRLVPRAVAPSFFPRHSHTPPGSGWS